MQAQFDGMHLLAHELPPARLLNTDDEPLYGPALQAGHSFDFCTPMNNIGVPTGLKNINGIITTLA